MEEAVDPLKKLDDSALKIMHAPVIAMEHQTIGKQKRNRAAKAASDDVIYFTGCPVETLNAWLDAASILNGSAFRSIPLPEAMEQSHHRSVQQASKYYNSAIRRSGRAARLID